MKAEVMDDHVVFRGAIKAEVPFEEIVAEARGTLLILTFRGNVVSVGAGSRCSQLASKIRSPPSWLDRLAIPFGVSGAVAGPIDAGLKGELATRLELSPGIPKQPVEVMLFAVSDAAGLDAVPKVAPLVSEAGALWVVFPEGAISAERVAAAAKGAGLSVGARSTFPGSRSAVKLQRR